MGLSVDEILKSLESEKTAEDIFAKNLVAEPEEKVAQEEVEEVVPEVDVETAPEETPEEAPMGETEDKEAEAKVDSPVVEKTAEEAPVAEEVDLQKLAEDLDAQGRIMARGFFDELVKLSSVEEEKVAEVEDADEGTKILMNLYNRYHGGNN